MFVASRHRPEVVPVDTTHPPTVEPFGKLAQLCRCAIERERVVEVAHPTHDTLRLCHRAGREAPPIGHGSQSRPRPLDRRARSAVTRRDVSHHYHRDALRDAPSRRAAAQRSHLRLQTRHATCERVDRSR